MTPDLAQLILHATQRVKNELWEDWRLITHLQWTQREREGRKGRDGCQEIPRLLWRVRSEVSLLSSPLQSAPVWCIMTDRLTECDYHCSAVLDFVLCNQYTVQSVLYKQIRIFGGLSSVAVHFFGDLFSDEENSLILYLADVGPWSGYLTNQEDQLRHQSGLYIM